MMRGGMAYSRLKNLLPPLPAFCLWPRWVVLAVLGFSLLTVLPLTVLEYGGDIMFQYVGIECFGSQFWSGDLYPRWCPEANAGLGSPVFMYYPPLPFFISSLLYPLTWFGVSVPSIYLMCLWLATFAGGLMAWLWLSDLTTPKKALLLSLVYLWMPYRMEVMMFRSGYGELWCLAWMPLVFKYARRIVRGETEAVPKLALAFALTFLSNMPAAVVGVLGSVGYSLLMARRDTTILPRYAGALLWGALLSALYLGPAIQAKSHITTEGVISGKRSWSNTYLTMANVTEHGQGHVVITIIIMLLALLGLIIFCYWRRDRLPDDFVRRERFTWGVMAAVAVFLLFPVSRWVWHSLTVINMLAFPWRMQLVMMMAAMGLGVIMLNYLLKEGREKSRTGDIVMLFFMLGLMGLFVISTRAKEFVNYGDKIMASQFVTQREYRTVWTNRRFISMPHILSRYDQLATIPKLQLLRGNAGFEIKIWEPGEVFLLAHVNRLSLLRLDLQYFPIWQVESTIPVRMAPDRRTGRMTLLLPRGDYPVHLTTSLYGMLGGYYLLYLLASLLALLALLWELRQQDKYKSMAC